MTHGVSGLSPSGQTYPNPSIGGVARGLDGHHTNNGEGTVPGNFVFVVTATDVQADQYCLNRDGNAAWIATCAMNMWDGAIVFAVDCFDELVTEAMRVARLGWMRAMVHVPPCQATTDASASAFSDPARNENVATAEGHKGPPAVSVTAAGAAAAPPAAPTGKHGQMRQATDVPVDSLHRPELVKSQRVDSATAGSIESSRGPLLSKAANIHRRLRSAALETATASDGSRTPSAVLDAMAAVFVDCAGADRGHMVVFMPTLRTVLNQLEDHDAQLEFMKALRTITVMHMGVPRADAQTGHADDFHTAGLRLAPASAILKTGIEIALSRGLITTAAAREIFTFNVDPLAVGTGAPGDYATTDGFDGANMVHSVLFGLHLAGATQLDIVQVRHAATADALCHLGNNSRPPVANMDSHFHVKFTAPAMGAAPFKASGFYARTLTMSKALHPTSAATRCGAQASSSGEQRGAHAYGVYDERMREELVSIAAHYAVDHIAATAVDTAGKRCVPPLRVLNGIFEQVCRDLSRALAEDVAQSRRVLAAGEAVGVIYRLVVRFGGRTYEYVGQTSGTGEVVWWLLRARFMGHRADARRPKYPVHQVMAECTAAARAGDEAASISMERVEAIASVAGETPHDFLDRLTVLEQHYIYDTRSCADADDCLECTNSVDARRSGKTLRALLVVDAVEQARRDVAAVGGHQAVDDSCGTAWEGFSLPFEMLDEPPSVPGTYGAARRATKAVALFAGVSWNKARARWCAEISVNGKGVYVGCFSSEVEAARAADAARAERRMRQQNAASFAYLEDHTLEDLAAEHTEKAKEKAKEKAEKGVRVAKRKRDKDADRLVEKEAIAARNDVRRKEWEDRGSPTGYNQGPNSSRYFGVIWVPVCGMWSAYYSFGKKQRQIGTYPDEAEAARAVDDALAKKGKARKNTNLLASTAPPSASAASSSPLPETGPGRDEPLGSSLVRTGSCGPDTRKRAARTRAGRPYTQRRWGYHEIHQHS